MDSGHLLGESKSLNHDNLFENEIQAEFALARVAGTGRVVVTPDHSV